MTVSDGTRLTPMTVRLQGVRVRFGADLESLNAFARTHFAEQEQDTDALPAAHRPDGPDKPAEIEAHVEWIEGAPPRVEGVAVSPGTVRLDRDIEVGQGKLAWSRIDDFLALRLRFALEENGLRLHGQHFFALSRSPLRNALQKARHWRRVPTLRAKRFSTILYYTVYYPAFWWLERRGLLPLHAAAVDLEGVGVVFCGLPGSGKSTLSLALLACPEARLLSDNLIFFDRERVFRCSEPVLADERSLGLIGPAASLLHPLGRHHVFGRAWCHVAPERLVDQTIPRLFLFVGLGPQSRLRPLSCQEALQRFTAANWIAQEVRRYLVYRAVLGLLQPEGRHPEPGAEPILRALLGQGQCYELIVGWGEGLHTAIAQVQTLVASVQAW